MRHCPGSSHQGPGADGLARRGCLEAGLAGLAGVLGSLPVLAPAAEGAPAAAAKPPGIPGPFPGRVVEVKHPGSIQGKSIVRPVVADMVARGMKELTGAPGAPDAWK